MIRTITFAAMLAVPVLGFITPGAVRAPTAANCERNAMRMSAEESSNRAQFIATSAAVATSAVALPLGALADDEVAPAPAPARQVENVALLTTDLGGQLEPFADVSKGYRLAKPIGWNRFEGEPGEYVVKMVDLVERSMGVLLVTTPVKSDTELSTIGDLASVGEKLRKPRDMKIVSARERLTEGIPFYDYEFKYTERRELRTFTVNKNKLWSLTVTCPEKLWKREEKVLKTIVQSFLPSLK